MRPEHSKLPRDVKLACEAILRFTKGRSLEDYVSDDMLRSAVERQFEIAGEAFVRLRNLDEELVDEISDARKAIAFRNILIHGYDMIRDEVAWHTAVNHVPVLLDAVNARLEQN